MAKKTIHRPTGLPIEIKTETIPQIKKDERKTPVKRSSIAVETKLVNTIKKYIMLEEEDSGSKIFIKDWIDNVIRTALKKELAKKNADLLTSLGVDINQL